MNAVRFAALIVLVLLVHAWMVAHTDLNPVIAGTIEAVAAVLSGFIEFGPKRKVRRWGRDAVWVLTQRHVLLPAYGIVLILSSIVSTVAVYSAGAGDVGAVRLGTEGSANFSEDKLTVADTEVRFFRYTNPLGRPLYLEVKGYQRHSFDLYPWFPVRVRVAKDLTVSPSLLVRVPDALFTFANGAHIKLTQGADDLGGAPVSGDSASVLFGQPRQVPDAFLQAFARELTIARESPETAAQRIEAWLNAVPVTPSRSITPGMHLSVVMMGANGELARRDFVVGNETIQDIRLLPSPSK